MARTRGNPNATPAAKRGARPAPAIAPPSVGSAPASHATRSAAARSAPASQSPATSARRRGARRAASAASTAAPGSSGRSASAPSAARATHDRRHREGGPARRAPGARPRPAPTGEEPRLAPEGAEPEADRGGQAWAARADGSGVPDSCLLNTGQYTDGVYRCSGGRPHDRTHRPAARGAPLHRPADRGRRATRPPSARSARRSTSAPRTA